MSVTPETSSTPAELIERFLNCVEYSVKPLERSRTMCGPAITMRLLPLQDRSRWYERERHPRELVHLARPGDVLVIDQGGDLDYTIWGGNVANNDGVAAQLGWSRRRRRLP